MTMAIYEVTTASDIEMGNGTVAIEADSPEEAAQKYGPLRAVDYFGDDAAEHVGEKEVIIVQEGLQPVHEITVKYV